MSGLIDKLSALTGPDSGLMHRAFFQCYPEPSQGPWWSFRFPADYVLWDRRWQRYARLVREGAWLSAAELLVPEGCETIALEITPNATRAAIGNDTADGFIGEAATAATPAIALCIASLKARDLT